MTVSIPINREAISVVVGIIVLLFTFITMVWFPSVFIAFLWGLVLLFCAVVFGSLAALATLNIFSLFAKDDDTDEDDDDDED